MITVSNDFKQKLTSYDRWVKAMVSVYKGTNQSPTYIFTQDDSIVKANIARNAEEGKLFGSAICQRLGLELIDTEKELDIAKGDRIKIKLGLLITESPEYIEYVDYPSFWVDEVTRDENNGKLSIVAYDMMQTAANHYTSEITLAAPYTIYQYAAAIATLLGTALRLEKVTSSDSMFTLSMTDGANIEGTENLRDILTGVAEATQTIAFINYEDKIVFKRLKQAASADLDITKHDYFTMKTGDIKTIKTLVCTNSLGDEISVSTAAADGVTVYIRDNVFYDKVSNLETVLQTALANLGTLIINEFNLRWRGNPATELGDFLKIDTDLDSNQIGTFILSDTINYNGGLSQETEYKYSDADEKPMPNTVGGMLKQTYAVVDKANKTINLHTTLIEEQEEAIGDLSIKTDSITTTVQQTTNEVSRLAAAAVTPEQVQITVQEQLANGVDSVTTSTGYSFNNEGLTITRTGSAINTTITEDGMTVKNDGDAVLAANHTGVQAQNLRTNFIIVAGLASFEEYNGRVGCFWVGGVS